MSLSEEISRLEAELAEARKVDERALARELGASGFACRRCAKCCSGAFGDNTVALFPFEIRRIMVETGKDWLEVAVPPESEDFDAAGNRHTFEWALHRKPNGDCLFLEGGLCSIYEHRPYICRTYPFRLEAGTVEQYDCDALGMGGPGESDLTSLARALVSRRIRELEETIGLLRRYEPYEPGASGDCRAVVVVHDSEGTKYVLRSGDGHYSFCQPRD